MQNKILFTLLIASGLILEAVPANAQSLREKAEQQEQQRQERLRAAKQVEIQEQRREAFIKKNGLVLGCESVIGYQFYVFYEGIVYTATAGGGRSRSYADASLGIKPTSFTRSGNTLTWSDTGTIQENMYEANFDNMTVYQKPSRSDLVEARKCKLIQRGQ